jgi:hypothetical protein
MNCIVIAVVVAAISFAGCDLSVWTAKPAVLADLEVAAEDPEGYDRALFGDYDRDAVLAATRRRWRACHGIYSAADNRCHASEDAVQVDHIVALSEAWDSGASEWTTVQLDDFAGDVDNLWVMTSELNLSKTDGDAAEWLPPHRPAVCDYITAYIAVKAEWHLTVDRREHRALADAVDRCTGRT